MSRGRPKKVEKTAGARLKEAIVTNWHELKWLFVTIVILVFAIVFTVRVKQNFLPPDKPADDIVITKEEPVEESPITKEEPQFTIE